MSVKSNEMLLYLSIINNGDWQKINNCINNHEDISDEIILEKIKGVKSKYITILDPEYPDYLKNVVMPPFVLYYYGDISLIQNIEKNIAVVGTRKYSKYGESVTRKFVASLSKKLNIVSGLAVGIDSIAAEECLINKGKTIAVLGSGIDYPYPPSNTPLYKQIKQKGLIISEYPGELAPLPACFPFRNRIIVGLSKNVLITEAKMKSGTSITANIALDMGETVMCVPERIVNESLCNFLVSVGGAKLVISPEDILEEFKFSSNRPDFEL